MQNSQGSSKEPFAEFRENVSIMLGLAQVIAMPAQVWLTRWGTAGERFFAGRLAVIAWLSMPVWGAFFGTHDPRPMFVFWGITTLLVLAHRVRHAWLRRRGYRPHSEFAGVSLFVLGGPSLIKRFWEPMWTAMCGGAILEWNRPLGMYLVLSAFGLMVCGAYSYAVEESMKRRIKDAKAEQEWIAGMMQEDDVA